MRMLPNGISDFEELIEENRIYIDKTMYIEKLEKISDKRIMFLRPRKFGKTLFTSTLEFYYDKNRKNKFEKLFKNTYIGKNPTSKKNSYCVLRFNFSGIDTSTVQSTIQGFRREVASSVEVFAKKYNIDFYINDDNTSEDIIDNLFKAFNIQKANEKIYVIIDEYDHFANELLGFNTDKFKEIIGKNGKVRKWYEILKKGTETVVDRIFITGVAPITLDSMTSGFNISVDLSKNIEFNSMLGFTKEEVINIMDELEISKEKQSKLMPIIKENYDGYVFSPEIEADLEKYRIYNSNMTLYFLNNYKRLNAIPNDLVDVNIISDYSKIEGFMNLCTSQNKTEILENIINNIGITSELTEKFNPEVRFGDKELISLLYYLGYLTIKDKEYGVLSFKAPNQIIKNIYDEYYLEYIRRMAEITTDVDFGTITKEVLKEGKIDKLIETLRQYLSGLSNRDYERFNEKSVQLILYTISKTIKEVYVKTEQEVNGKYTDFLIRPNEKFNERYGVLIELKYIKKEDYKKNKEILVQKQEEAKEQLLKYKTAEEYKMLEKFRAYSVVVVKDEVYVEEV